MLMNIATVVEISSWIVFLLISALLLRQAVKGFVTRYLRQEKGENLTSGPYARHELGTFITIVGMVVFSRLAIFLWAYLSFLLSQNQSLGFWEALPRLWDRWDSNHYLFLAEHGYHPEPGREWAASFAPLFPLCIRIFHNFISNYFIAGLLVSHLGLIIGAYFLYKLVLLDYEEAVAFRALKYLLIYPFSFFLNIAFSEGLFFVFAITTFYFLRRGKYALAGFMSMFALLTRFITVPFFLVFFFAEYISDPKILKILRERNWLAWRKDFIHRESFLAWLGCGMLCYCLFYQSVFGDGLAYFHYQKTFWYHRFLFFPQNLKGMLMTMASYKFQDNVALWGSEIALFFVLAGLLVLGIRHMRFSYNLLFSAYLFGIYSTYWLISSGRYFAGFFPAAIVLAVLSKNKIINMILTLAQIILLALYVFIFTRGSFLM